ncbi:MAG: 50S ribosomal protein L23 [Flavobacteriales bacterium]
MGVLIRPIVTEKASRDGEMKNRFHFLVEPAANKIEIRNAVESQYGVTVDKVRTQRYRGKGKSRFTKSGVITGRHNHSKKAIVALAEGDTIDLYSDI